MAPATVKGRDCYPTAIFYGTGEDKIPKKKKTSLQKLYNFICLEQTDIELPVGEFDADKAKATL